DGVIETVDEDFSHNEAHHPSLEENISDIGELSFSDMHQELIIQENQAVGSVEESKEPSVLDKRDEVLKQAEMRSSDGNKSSDGLNREDLELETEQFPEPNKSNSDAEDDVSNEQLNGAVSGKDIISPEAESKQE